MSSYFKAKVTNNFPLDKKTYLLTVRPLEKTSNPRPGQFYMIGVGNYYDPLLKRPFSLFRKKTYGLQFLYVLKGKGTLIMRDLKKGDILNLVGPVGNGYPEPLKGYVPLLVAGGTGIASIFSFAEKINKEAYIIYGARCKEELTVLADLKHFKGQPIFCTDDGSFGKKGTVVEVLRYLLKNNKTSRRYLIYACGPSGMLKAISELATDKGIKGYFSLEENMACGFGACQGCVVKTTEGYKRICKEGPVFPIEEIVWE